MQDAVDEWMDGNVYAREPLMRHYVEYALKRGDDGRWVWRFDAGRLYDFVATMNPDELRAALDRITAPTLLIRGRDSEILTEAAAADVLRRLRDGSFAEIRPAPTTSACSNRKRSRLRSGHSSRGEPRLPRPRTQVRPTHRAEA